MWQDAAEAPEIEELALPVGAVVVVNRHLGEVEAGILELLYQLQTDCAVGRLQIDQIEHLAPEQAEVAVDIAELEAKHELYEMMIHAPDHDPMDRIVALNLP